ncbi:MAG: chitobiase/beta-hexosaminidase C-terminal domain-containing protein [Clostridiales bacterium]|nr:chitobiase/beta-hexosaminidase C-terminal domain-containing protein [Clostridiales bacterium]
MTLPFEYDLSWSGNVITYADLASSEDSDEEVSYKSLLASSEQKIYDAIDSKLSTSGIMKNITSKTFSFSDGTSFSTPMLQADISASSIGVSITADSAGNYWDYISDAGLAYIYDNPDQAWICNFTASISTSGRKISTIHYYFFSTSDYSAVTSDLSALEDWTDSILSVTNTYSTTYGKLKYMHDKLCGKTSYNYTSLSLYFGDEAFRYAHAASGIVALDNQVVCEGYAKAYKILCDESDIPCLLMTSTDHMWNIVQMDDGEWYGVDTTWDDDTTIGYNYFLKGESVFQDHSYTSPFSFELAYDDYENTTTTTTTTTSTTTTTTTEATTETTTEVITDENYVAPPAFTVTGVFGGRNVTFTSGTAEAVIYYSADTYILTTDDTMVSNGETVLFEDFYGTIYARAYYDGKWSDVSRLILKIPVTAAPEITADGSSVTIASGTPSSFVCYTTDGTEPVVDTDGTAVNGTWIRKDGARVNSGTITVDPGVTVKAIAVRSCFTNSVSASAYVPVGSPQFTVVGAYGGRNVTFTSSTERAVIYYSADDYVLSTNDTKVSNGQTVLFEDFYGTIYARAYYNGVWSDVSRLILKIPVVDAPEVTYEGNVVRLVSSTKDSFICYTTDGTDPVVEPDGTVTNGTWIKVNGARTTKGSITVSSGTTVKAIAVRNCFTNSSVTSCTVS